MDRLESVEYRCTKFICNADFLAILDFMILGFLKLWRPKQINLAY
jgi:hypothetical protein